MFQPDFFAPSQKGEPLRAASIGTLDLPDVLAQLTERCTRPRYSFMVLNLIAKVSARTGEAGPYVREGVDLVPIRDWLSNALAPVAQRDPRRLAIVERVRAELSAIDALPTDAAAAASLIAEQVRHRILLSGRTNVSRAVSELVHAGFVRRYYQGWRVDHQNRGGQRQAVYSLPPEVRNALGQY